jgi:hypothetical protein
MPRVKAGARIEQGPQFHGTGPAEFPGHRAELRPGQDLLFSEVAHPQALPGQQCAEPGAQG